MPRSFRQIINAAVAEKRFLVVPGAHDALSARLIGRIGFDAYFIGGFPAVGARYGVPDIGLKGFGEICNPFIGGHTPILGMAELAALGFNCAMLGVDTLMHAAKAVEAVLVDMKTGQFARRNDGMDFEDYKKLVGYDKWESIDERFGPHL